MAVIVLMAEFKIYFDSMIYFQAGSENTSLSNGKIREGLFTALDKLGRRNKVLAVPPDFTRFHSRAGDLTTLIHDYYGEKLTDVLPALGTHSPMTREQLEFNVSRGAA